jgi:ferredoxin
MKVRPEIDAGKCLGNGMCAVIAPDSFAIDDYGESTVLREEVSGDPAAIDAVLEARAACPAQAISVQRLDA